MKKFLYCFVIFGITFRLFGFTDQTTTERVIKENKMFIEFLDVCMSNFDSDSSKKGELFFNSYQAHFNAEVSFLQSDYRRAFKNIYKSQDINVKLYNDVLNEYYLDESKKILDKLAPSIIKSKNSAARQYLTLGYRDRSLARNIQKIGHASRPNLRSHKIYNFVEAIKYARRAMRYALLALFESQDVENKKYIYSHMFEAERERNNPFYNRFLDKDDKGLIDEINREYEDYEKEYGPKLEAQLKAYEDTGKIPDKSAGAGEDAETLDPAAGGQKASTTTKDSVSTEYLYEKKIERRLRFKEEKRVARYIRNGEFELANEIIVKYVDDFNFKLIEATIEVMEVKEEENQMGIDFPLLMTHHTDNYARYAKNSVIDQYSGKVKVEDDIDNTSKSKETGVSEGTKPENGGGGN